MNTSTSPKQRRIIALNSLLLILACAAIVSPITTVDELNHSTFASAPFKFNFSRSLSYGVLPLSALCGR